VPPPNKNDFVRADPVFGSLFATSRRRLWTILIAVLIPLLCHFPIAYLASKGQNADEVVTTTAYVAYNVFWLLVTPPAFVLYLYLSATVSNLFAQLHPLIHSVRNESDLTADESQGRPDNPERAAQEFRARCLRLWGHPLWTILALLIVAGIWTYLTAVVWPEEQKLRSAFWLSKEVEWYRPVFILGYTPTLFILWLLVLKSIVSIGFVSRWFQRFHVEVTIFHPDGVGGLGPVGAHVSRVLLFAGFFGLVTMAYVFRVGEIYSHDRRDWLLAALERPDLFSYVVVYLFTAPACPVVPILHVHRRMTDARGRRLSGLREEYNRLMRAIVNVQEMGDEELKRIRERLEGLSAAYHEVYSNFPIWPFVPSAILFGFVGHYVPLLLPAVEWLVREVARGLANTSG